MALGLELADHRDVERTVHVSRRTANRATWMRLIRSELDRLQLSHGVVGLSVRVDEVGAAETAQCDMFDRSLQARNAYNRPRDNDIAPFLMPMSFGWQVREPGDLTYAEDDRAQMAEAWPGAPRQLLQVLPELRRVAVKTMRRGGHDHVPARVRTLEGQDLELLTLIGPDRVAMGAEMGMPYTREYFTCLTDNGLLVLLFRDTTTDTWYLHGWLD